MTPATHTHIAHPLTRLPKTPPEQDTLEIDGRTYRVVKLRSKALPDRPGAKTSKSLTTREKKRLLSKKQRDAINLGLRLENLTSDKQVEKLAERVVKRKKHELCRQLGCQKLSPKQRHLHPEVYEATEAEIAKEREDVMDLVVWFRSF